MEAILIIVFVVGLVEAIGHTIWLVLAALFRAMFGTEPPPPPRASRPRRHTCPACQRLIALDERRCPECDLFLYGRLAERLDKLRDAQREVLALVESGGLDATIAQDIGTRLDQRAKDLFAGREGQVTALPPTAPISEEPGTVSLAAMTLAEPFALMGASACEPPTAAHPTPPADEPAADAEQPRQGILAAFMEERNILWGELVGGLLIVGCSIALVLTLWRSLEALPYFPFLLATGITAALYGAGQYSLHHWKLAATSRGLLVICLLLTPLNLLLLAVPGSDIATGWLDIAIKAAAMLLFVGMVRGAGRDLIGTQLLPGPVDRRWLLALAVVGAPASQILTAGWAAGAELLLPSWLAALCNTFACGAVLGGLTWYRSREKREALTGQQSGALLIFVGISLIALLAAWGLVLTRAPDVSTAVAGLAVPLALAAIPMTEAGTLVQRRAPGEAGLKATGTGVALAGTMLLATGVVLGWRDPVRLLLVSLLAGVYLTRVAWRESLPWIQIGAIPALALATVLLFLGITGQWTVPTNISTETWIRELLVSPMSAIVLMVYGLILAGFAETCVRIGNRAQSIAYALGGVGAGIVALLQVSSHGFEHPWPAVAVHTLGTCGLLAANVRWRQRIVAEAGCWLILVGTLWCLRAVTPDLRTNWGFAIALVSLVLAISGSAIRRSSVVTGQLRSALADVSVAAGVTTVALTLVAPDFPSSWMAAAAFLTLALSGLLLARLFAKSWPMWAGSAATLIGLLLLTTYATPVRPTSVAWLLATLGHSTLALVGAWLLAGKQSRGHLIAEPLWQSARITSVLAVPILFFPAAGLAIEWAAFAAWLALVWFAMSWVWRVSGAFSSSQSALSAAAVFCGLGWVEHQPWWRTTTFGIFDPLALQALGIALALLHIAWLSVRAATGRNERLKTLWFRDPFSVDRAVIGFVVVAQLIVLAVAIEPAVQTELTPSVTTVRPPFFPELAGAFGSGAWLLLGLLNIGLVARLRLSKEDEPSSDGPLFGLAVLLVSLPLVWAGNFQTEVASGTALRWGLASAFLVGSMVLFFREALGRAAAGGGVRLRATLLSTQGSYVLFAFAAAFVLLITAELTILGLNRTTPSGPVAGSVFASIGYTASFVVPLGLLIVGMASSAIRERLAGYAFAAGMVWTAALASGYALVVITSGGVLNEIVLLRLGMLAVGSTAVWALLWLFAERRVPGGRLLELQSTFGLLGLGILSLSPLGRLFGFPDIPLPIAFTEIGRLGWIVLALAGWAGFARANRSNSAICEHVVGFVCVVAGLMAACTVQSWDEPGACVSYLTMCVSWAIAWMILTAASFRSPIVARGRWLIVLSMAIALAALVAPLPHVGPWPVPLALAVVGMIGAAIAWWTSFPDGDPSVWDRLISSQVIFGAVGSFLAVRTAIDAEQLIERLAGPFTFIIVAFSLGLLVWAAPAAWAGRLRLATIAVTAGGIALIGWAIPQQSEPVVWLQRNVWAFVALVSAVVACLDVVPRLRPGTRWVADARRVAGHLALIALITLVAVLVQQVPVFNPITKRTPLQLPAVLSVLCGIAVLIRQRYLISILVCSKGVRQG